MKIATSLRTLASTLVLALATATVSATTLSGTYLRSSDNFFSGIATDKVSGMVYLKSDYAGAEQVTVYANQAAFEAGTVLKTVTLGAATYGTYFAVQDGVLYARTSSVADNRLSLFDANTGAVVEKNIVAANMSGLNFDATFDWGGYSAINAMSDGSKLYLVSGDSALDGAFRINSYGFDMTALNSYKVDVSTPGFAFAINGYIFFGESYNAGVISRRINTATGELSLVDFTLDNVGYYISDVSYDAFDNTLYVHSGKGIYRIGDADEAFAVAQQTPQGAPVSDVPEPSSVMLVGIALAALGAARRLKKQA